MKGCKDFSVKKREGQLNKYNITSYSNYLNVGIVLGTSENGTISDCRCYDNHDDGIRINSCNDCNVLNCDVYDNGDDGIDLSWAPCTNNIISGNNCNNNRHGIVLYQADNNYIYENNLFSNSGYGIYPWDSSNNLIYHNNLNNTNNAQDENTNLWYNATIQEGNHWSDYTGTDGNDDGIGDTPYSIPGGNNQDLYPLMYPFEMYYILNISLDNHEVNETTTFNVTVKTLGGTVVPYAQVLFDDQIYFTDSNGITVITAPSVIEDTVYQIIAIKPGYTSDNDTILVKNVPQESVRAFIFGKITNLSSQGDYIQFEAVKTRVIIFSPFSFITYVSGEKFTIPNDYIGRMIISSRYMYIIALCKILI